MKEKYKIFENGKLTTMVKEIKYVFIKYNKNKVSV